MPSTWLVFAALSAAATFPAFAAWLLSTWFVFAALFAARFDGL
jgi:hypothetical protein